MYLSLNNFRDVKQKVLFGMPLLAKHHTHLTKQISYLGIIDVSRIYGFIMSIESRKTVYNVILQI